MQGCGRLFALRHVNCFLQVPGKQLSCNQAINITRRYAMKTDSVIKLICVFFSLALVLAAPGPAAATTEILEMRLSGSENDAEESSLGAILLNGVTLDIGGGYRKIGMRFTNITIPKNAPITRAYIEFTTKSQDSATTTFKIEGQASDNAGSFADSGFNISVRPTYTTDVDWLVNYPWLTENEVHQTADITAIVQKIVDRSGWASGNAMVFILSNDDTVYRKAYTYDSDPNKAPKLHIEYAVNVIDVRVSASTDDINQSSIPPNTITNGNDVLLSYSSYTYSGFRFQNVNIPQGAVINSASLKFVAKADYAATTGYMRLQGEKRLNAPTFSTSTTSNDSLYKRMYGSTTAVPKTTYVQWANTAAWTTGTETPPRT